MGETVKVLKKEGYQIFAAMRDTKKFDSLGFVEAEGDGIIKAVQVSHADSEKIGTILREENIENVLIIPPGSEDRGDLVLKSIEGAKIGKAKFVLLQSVPVPKTPKILFERQFSPAEEAIKDSGMNYAICQLPFFMENIFGQQKSIQSGKAFYGPLNENDKYVVINLGDAAKAFAKVLKDQAKHNGKTYLLASDEQTEGRVASAFSKENSDEVKYVKVPFQGLADSFEQQGWPKWQAEGVAELYKNCSDKASHNVENTGDLEKLLGHKPTTTEDFIKAVAPMFK